MADVEDIIGGLKQVLGKDGDLAGKSVIVTAGGTQEPIDPVRHIGNRSSGKMGYAIAEAARDRGANVTLVSTQTSLRAPYGVEFVRADTAEEMRKEVVGRALGADILVMAAAVADFRPATEAEHKIKKSGGWLTLELRETADVLAEAAGDRLVKVGFAAESRDLVSNAREKMRRKGVDLMVANNITDEGSGFGSDTNRVVIIGSDGVLDELPLLPKSEVAHLSAGPGSGNRERLRSQASAGSAVGGGLGVGARIPLKIPARDVAATARTTDSTRKTRRCPMLQASAPPVKGPRPQAIADAEFKMPKAAPRCFLGSIKPTIELSEVIIAPLNRPDSAKSSTKRSNRWLKNWGRRVREAPRQETIRTVRRFNLPAILPTNMALTPEVNPRTPNARPVSRMVRLASVIDWMKPGATG